MTADDSVEMKKKSFWDKDIGEIFSSDDASGASSSNDSSCPSPNQKVMYGSLIALCTCTMIGLLCFFSWRYSAEKGMVESTQATVTEFDWEQDECSRRDCRNNKRSIQQEFNSAEQCPMIEPVEYDPDSPFCLMYFDLQTKRTHLSKRSTRTRNSDDDDDDDNNCPLTYYECYVATVTYEFTDDRNEKHTGDWSEEFDKIESLEKFEEKWDPSKQGVNATAPTVTIYYHPENPGRFGMEESDAVNVAWVAGVVVFALCSCSLLGFLVFYLVQANQ